jgi:selenocysteine lyase/cysteine desulfurase
MGDGDLSKLVGNADVFPVLRKWRFFNHAGVCPLPRPVTDAFRTFAAEAETAAYLQTSWFRDIDKLRATAAGLINARKDEIAFVKNTSEGISIVASGIDWQFGDRIVTTSVEYPANVYPWMEVERGRGAKLVKVEEETDDLGRRHVPVEKILEAASDARTRMVTLSHVEFASGQRHDLARIGKFCRERKILFNVDAIQSIGVLPVDVQAMNIDFLSADGHKWMLGPEGAGIFYCRRELIEHTRPLMVGWMNVVDAQNYGDYDYTLKSDAGRFECGSYNVPGLLALKASIDMISRVGVDAISKRVKKLTDHLIDGLIVRGYDVVSPRMDWQWSGIVSFTSPRFAHMEITTKLRAKENIEIVVREGRLRASPHFYNTESEIDALLGALPGH